VSVAEREGAEFEGGLVGMGRLSSALRFKYIENVIS